MTVVCFSRAYRSFRGGSGRLDTHLDTPPSINRRHPNSCLAVTVAEEAIVPDAVKPVRQHMNEEAADELPTIQRHRLLAVAIPVILPAEPDLAVVHRPQPVIGHAAPLRLAAATVHTLR